MRKAIVILTLLALLLSLGLFQVVQAASTAYITIEATGSELSITVNQTTWDAGTLQASENAVTGINWGQVTNDGSESIKVSVYGNEMKDQATGTAKTWTLNSSGTPGSAAIAVKMGVDDDDDTYDVTVKEYDDGSFNYLQSNASTELTTSSSWSFGIQLFAPTASVGNYAMRMCDIAGSETDDTDDGICLTAEYYT